MSILRHNEISLPLLPGWTDGSQIILLGPTIGDVRTTLVITRELIAEGKTLDTFVIDTIRNVKSVMESFSLEYEGRATYGSWNGYKIEYSFTAEGKKLKQMMFFTPYQSYFYSLTLTDAWSHFDVTKKEGESIISRLVLR